MRGFVTAVIGVSALLVAPAAAQPKPTPAPAQQPAPKPAQIDRNGVLILIRTTLIALHQANETGNYTVLRDIAAPGFRDANTASRLAEIFANLRNQKLDLSGVAALDPQLTLLPQIEPNGLMHMAGFFPSVPTQVTFELLFAPVDGRWRPFGISVGVGSSSPAAPMPSPAPQAAVPPPAPAAARAAEKPAAKPALKSQPGRPAAEEPH